MVSAIDIDIRKRVEPRAIIDSCCAPGGRFCDVPRNVTDRYETGSTMNMAAVPGKRSASMRRLVSLVGTATALALAIPMLITPAAPVSAATTPVPRLFVGAAAPGSTSYPVPAGSVFVDGSNGNDSAAGNQSSPLRSIAAAVSRAGSGGTIVIRRGSYNESVVIPYDKSLTVQAYPGESVWMDGSVPVTNWTRSGSRWVASNWSPQFSSNIDGKADNSRFLQSGYPMAARPDQVFVNGTALRQVASSSEVVAGTFAVDYSARTLTIGDDPSGRELRASNKAQAIYVQSPGTTLQGFGVRRYATTYDLRGAIKMENVNSVLRDMTVVDNATIGVTISNNNALVERVTIQRSGMLGLGMSAAYGSVVRNSTISQNNTENFKPAPVSGGIKITRTRGITVTGNDVSNNFSSIGIWFDESCYDIRVTNNKANGNSKAGIQLELSDTAIVANNEALGADAGIHIYNTGNVKVWNNNVGGSRLFGLKLSQDERRQATHSTGRDPRRPVPDSTVPWITRNITISNNAFGNGGAFQFYALDGRTNTAVDNMNVTIDGNLFNRRVVSSNPTMVAWGKGDNVTLERYETPSALATAKNGSWRNAQTANSLPIASMGPDMSSASSSVAKSLPSDVAAATGLSTGLRRVGRV